MSLFTHNKFDKCLIVGWRIKYSVLIFNKDRIQVNICLIEHNMLPSLMYCLHVMSCPSWFLFVPSEHLLSRITAATLLGNLRYLSLYITEIQRENSPRSVSPTQIARTRLQQPRSWHFQWTLLFFLCSRFPWHNIFGLFRLISEI